MVKPFNFHEPKNDPSLRKYMDEDNQNINPTKRRARSVKINRDIFEAPVHNPPTTKKHDAMVEVRRKKQQEKLEAKISEQREKFVRDIKSVRMA